MFSQNPDDSFSKDLRNPSMAAYCGIYCGACFIRKAYFTHKMEIIPEAWQDLAKRAPSLHCEGCRSNIVYKGCQGCQLRNCAKCGQIEFCFLCNEYPCKYFEGFKAHSLPHFKDTGEALEYIQKHGVESWLTIKAARFQCPHCGDNYSWYEQICLKCGLPLKNPFKLPEN